MQVGVSDGTSRDLYNLNSEAFLDYGIDYLPEELPLSGFSNGSKYRYVLT